VKCVFFEIFFKSMHPTLGQVENEKLVFFLVNIGIVNFFIFFY
jgi:hypothetical protein